MTDPVGADSLHDATVPAPVKWPGTHVVLGGGVNGTGWDAHTQSVRLDQLPSVGEKEVVVAITH